MWKWSHIYRFCIFTPGQRVSVKFMSLDWPGTNGNVLGSLLLLVIWGFVGARDIVPEVSWKKPKRPWTFSKRQQQRLWSCNKRRPGCSMWSLTKLQICGKYVTGPRGGCSGERYSHFQIRCFKFDNYNHSKLGPQLPEILCGHLPTLPQRKNMGKQIINQQIWDCSETYLPNPEAEVGSYRWLSIAMFNYYIEGNSWFMAVFNFSRVAVGLWSSLAIIKADGLLIERSGYANPSIEIIMVCNHDSGEVSGMAWAKSLHKNQPTITLSFGKLQDFAVNGQRYRRYGK